MRVQGLSLLLAMAVLFAAASVAAADPATVNTTANSIGASDNTGDAIADIQADDVSGASPGSVSTDDGWYTVDQDGVMFIDGFNTTGISGTITGVVLNVQYSVEAGYGGSNPVQWAFNAGTLAGTGITPANGEEDKVASYDLYAQGVDTVGEISTLDVEFTSNDNAGGDAVSFDYVFVTVTYNNPPVAGTPQTYDSTTLSPKTAFERNDGMFINVSVTDANGASELDTVLITISNTTGSATVDNDTMILDYPIGDGYVYNYSWTVPDDADMGTWTINVYANDTSDAWDSSSTTFTVQDTQAPEWSNAQTNKTPVYENDSVKFTADWTDDVALAGYIFSTNQTGAWVNSSFVSFSGTSDVSESTTQITATAGTTVGWRFYATDTSDNGNATDIQSFVVASPPPPPSSPYMIYGWAFYKNGTACNDPVVNITNSNTSKQWQAETNVNYSYYRLILDTTNISVGNVLEFSASGCSQANTTEHTVTQAEINDGGMFNFNITLASPDLVIYTISNRTITPPQTTVIDVEFSERVTWKIAIENGGVVYDWTGTSTNPNKRTWNGTYEGNDTIVPDGTYTVNITWTNTTTDLGDQNNTETITVSKPPASITDLANTTYQETYINWTWTDPEDADFSKVMVYLNGSFKENVTDGVQFYNATGLTADTEYEISTHTVDSVGNINDTWENHTARTKPTPDTTGTCGDVNGDDKVNIGDVIRLANHVGFPTDSRFCPADDNLADVNGDDKVNIGDVIRLANHVGFPTDSRFTPNCK